MEATTGSWKTNSHRVSIAHITHSARRKPVPNARRESDTDQTAVSVRHSSSSVEAVVDMPINHHFQPSSVHFSPSATLFIPTPPANSPGNTQYRLNRTPNMAIPEAGIPPSQASLVRTSNSSLNKPATPTYPSRSGSLSPMLDLSVPKSRFAEMQRSTPLQPAAPVSKPAKGGNRRQASLSSVNNRRESTARRKASVPGDSDVGTESMRSESSNKQESDLPAHVTRRRAPQTQDGRRRSSIMSDVSTASSFRRSSESSPRNSAYPTTAVVPSSSPSPSPSPTPSGPVPSTPPVQLPPLLASTPNPDSPAASATALPRELPPARPRPRPENPNGWRNSMRFSMAGRLKGKDVKEGKEGKEGKDGKDGKEDKGKWYQFWKKFKSKGG